MASRRGAPRRQLITEGRRRQRYWLVNPPRDSVAEPADAISEGTGAVMQLLLSL